MPTGYREEGKKDDMGGNVTLNLGEGTNVNLRVETHPLETGGPPVRHANVEVTQRNARGQNKVKENTHTVDEDTANGN